MRWMTKRREGIASPGSVATNARDSYGPEPEADACTPRQQALLEAVHRGVADPTASAPLAASFGAQAAMRFDFAHAQVLADPMAWRALRVGRTLPQWVDAAEADEPGPRATWREMDLTLWDLGVAAGSVERAPLRDEPGDWWQTRLMPVMLHSLPRYSATPAHRELARALLDHGPATAASLARRCRVSTHELRCFVQAGLFLVLLYWMPATVVEL